MGMFKKWLPICLAGMCTGCALSAETLAMLGMDPDLAAAMERSDKNADAWEEHMDKCLTVACKKDLTVCGTLPEGEWYIPASREECMIEKVQLDAEREEIQAKLAEHGIGATSDCDDFIYGTGETASDAEARMSVHEKTQCLGHYDSGRRRFITGVTRERLHHRLILHLNRR